MNTPSTIANPPDCTKISLREWHCDLAMSAISFAYGQIIDFELAVRRTAGGAQDYSPMQHYAVGQGFVAEAPERTSDPRWPPMKEFVAVH